MGKSAETEWGREDDQHQNVSGGREVVIVERVRRHITDSSIALTVKRGWDGKNQDAHPNINDPCISFVLLPRVNSPRAMRSYRGIIRALRTTALDHVYPSPNSNGRTRKCLQYPRWNPVGPGCRMFVGVWTESEPCAP
ncbi:hypothetical protein E4U53_001831 [Claviceps sorghi]|nr:hypothetical protein E4U53_001831 [Claviceps sorghi]